MTEDWSRDPAWLAYAQHALKEMWPKMVDSALMVSICPRPDPGRDDRSIGDVKYWTELGASIMLDKPIIVLVRPGQTVPERLRRVADRVVEADLNLEADQVRLAEILEVEIAKLP